MSLAPVLGGNVFSLAFGRMLDARGVPEGGVCGDGRTCYSAALYVALVASGVALGLAVWAAWRDAEYGRTQARTRVRGGAWEGAVEEA